MLFELGGRRKRFIQVIYVFLALLLGGSLVFFGIGGDAPGGLGDAIGISPNSAGSTGNDALDRDIEAANATLAEDPDDQAALLSLANAHTIAGLTALNAEEEEAALSRYEAATDAFSRFLEATGDGRRIRDADEAASVATRVIQAYQWIPVTQESLDEGVRVAEIAVAERPTTTGYLQLALFAYAAGRTDKADRAAEDALEQVDESNRSTVDSQLEQARRQGRQIQRQLEAQAAAETPTQEEFQNPLGGFGDQPAPGGGVPPG